MYHTEPKAKQRKKENQKVKTEKLRSFGIQSGESVESTLKKKKKDTMEGFAERGRFQAWNERVRR